MKLNLPKNFGKMEEVPQAKKWIVVDKMGKSHEVIAQGFNPAGDGRVDFFLIKQPAGSIIQSTEMLQKTICSFYHPTFISVPDEATPAQN